MTYQTNCTLPEEILEQIAEEGMEAIPEMIRLLVNEAMRLQREQHLGAAHYERQIIAVTMPMATSRRR